MLKNPVSLRCISENFHHQNITSQITKYSFTYRCMVGWRTVIKQRTKTKDEKGIHQICHSGDLNRSGRTQKHPQVRNTTCQIRPNELSLTTRSLKPQVFQLDPVPLGSIPYHSNLGWNEHCIGFLSDLCMVGTQAEVFKVHDTV